MREEKVILQLRNKYKDELEKVVAVILSHPKVSIKNTLALMILDMIYSAFVNRALDKYFLPILKHLSEIDSRSTQKVSLKARELVILCQMPSYEECQAQIYHILQSSVTERAYGGRIEYCTPKPEAYKDLIDTKFNVFDVLPKFFYDNNPYVPLAAIEVHYRRSYHAY